eukprot:CAMPEP_0119548530 /NCGR_PEP_ID=MMETSP1352-20130426/2436_1 /TAXON_ID=265584 /ORGANISM="Stauroneis constricta, Strain CCMP1120" /LENGTH=593 /DNA_ID=CAMNT_0007593835 /DNA_START=66 /DNA_END=1847 /DNA_ORIENTATION=+
MSSASSLSTLRPTCCITLDVVRNGNCLVAFTKTECTRRENNTTSEVVRNRLEDFSLQLDSIDFDGIDTIEFRCAIFCSDTTREAVHVLDRTGDRIRTIIVSSSVCDLIKEDAMNTDQCLADLYAAFLRTNVTTLKMTGSSSILFRQLMMPNENHDDGDDDDDNGHDVASSYHAQQRLFQEVLQTKVQNFSMSLPNSYDYREEDAASSTSNQINNNNDDDDGDDGEHEFLLPFQPLLNGIALSTSLQYFSVWGGIFPSHSNPVVNRHNDEDDRDANNSIISNFVDCLQRNRSIQVLNLRFMNVSDSVLGRLCGALANHPSLHSLNLSGSKCSARTLTALASIMTPSSSSASASTSSHASPPELRLRVLDLSNLRLHLTPSFDAEKHDESLRHAWAAFCKTLAINTSLVELNVSGSGFFNRGKGLCYNSVSALADALHHNSTLRQLDVSSCSLDDRSILLFTTHALLQQSHLQEWKIKYNPISKHSTLIAIIKMLRHNNVYLESIDFRGRASRNHDITNEEELKLQIKYWTTLNRSGRRLLLSSSSSNDDDETSIGIWPHVFCQISRTTAQRNDAISAHDVIYFFLKNQPTLFAS